MRKDDVNLPWQFVLLGFFVFGAIFATMLLVFSLMPSMQMRTRTAETVRWISIPYLAAGLGATPYLIRSGRARFNRMNPTSATTGKRAQPMSRGKRLGV